MYELPALVIGLKLIMAAVMLGGGVAVLRELIAMARGRSPVTLAAEPAPEDA